MDDTEQPVGWYVLVDIEGKKHVYGRDLRHDDRAQGHPFPTLERARQFALLPTDQILTLEEARIWMTLNNL